MKEKKQKSKVSAVSVNAEMPLQPEVANGTMLRAAYHRKMMDSIPFLVWLKDKDSKILAANTFFAKMAGVADSSAIEGKTDFDCWPKNLAESYIKDDQEVLDSGEPIIKVEQIKKNDGELYWAETYKAPVVINDEVVGTVGYARDISEQKNLLSAINKKELEYSSLVKNIPLSIIRYDKDCRRIFVNVTIKDFASSDGNTQALLGKTPTEQWNPNIKNITAKEFQKKLTRVISQGESETFELCCECEGVTYVNMVNLLPEFDEHSQTIGAIAVASDVSDISKYRYELEHLAYHDALTSLPNRTLLNQRLRLAASSGKPFGLVFMDLDLFKTINDTLGHIVGDELLVDVAKRLSASVRGDDIVARIGGDEFAILVGDLKDNSDLDGLATKIATKLSVPFNEKGINFFVTASIGIACYPTDSEDVEDLIKYADTAMYEAKRLGRNNHQFYTPELTQGVMEHLAIATALRYAIPKQELTLLFQPKVDIETAKILGAEALLRWHGKVLGQIQPDKFIPIAEESGLIIEIGAWVLRATCEAAVQLNEYREEPLMMAVNVSSKEFAGTHFLDHLKACLQETGCKPEWLTIEITESLLLSDSPQALEALTEIDSMGIILSIDDFGTGYSALAYLSKFPIRQVKIDRSFVMDICDSENAATLVKAIIAMTHSLGKDLVAEGIETKAQADLMKAYGCHDAQGYLYSKPVSFSELISMIGQQKNY